MYFTYLAQYFGTSLKKIWMERKSPTPILVASSGAPTPTWDSRGLPCVNKQKILFNLMFPEGVIIETSKYQGSML